MIRFEIVYAQVSMYLQQKSSISISFASILHCVHKTSSGLKIFNFSSIEDETRRKFFLCFFPLWFFLLNGLQQTCLNREFGISVLIWNRWTLEEHLQKTKTAVSLHSLPHVLRVRACLIKLKRSCSVRARSLQRAGLFFHSKILPAYWKNFNKNLETKKSKKN